MQKKNIGGDICCSHILKRKDAEVVITFTKAGNLLSPGSFFTKKIYLKQNGEFIAETICYHTKVYIGKSENLLKLLHITFESNKIFVKLKMLTLPQFLKVIVPNLSKNIYVIHYPYNEQGYYVMISS